MIAPPETALLATDRIATRSWRGTSHTQPALFMMTTIALISSPTSVHSCRHSVTRSVGVA